MWKRTGKKNIGGGKCALYFKSKGQKGIKEDREIDSRKCMPQRQDGEGVSGRIRRKLET